MTEFIYSTRADDVCSPGAQHSFMLRHPRMPRHFAGISLVVLWMLILLTSWAPRAHSQEDIELASDLIELSLNDFFNFERIEFDMTARYVDGLDDLGINTYITLDARLGWRPHEDIELSIVGQNLLDEERFEYLETVHSPVSTGLERGVYGKLTWQF